MVLLLGVYDPKVKRTFGMEFMLLNKTALPLEWQVFVTDDAHTSHFRLWIAIKMDVPLYQERNANFIVWIQTLLMSFFTFICIWAFGEICCTKKWLY